MVSGHNDCLVRFWDVGESSPRLTSQLTGHKGWVWCVHPYGPEGETNVMVSGATDSRLLMWDRRASYRPLQQASRGGGKDYVQYSGSFFFSCLDTVMLAVCIGVWQGIA